MGSATRLILVFDADSGLAAMLADIVKKAVGREDCALCEITYSPLGKRQSWKACEARLGIPVHELHRNEVPANWGLNPSQLPCVLVQVGDATPVDILARDAIASCHGSVETLERQLREALAGRT